VIKYWPEKGQSGFIVWRYRLRRDDEVIYRFFIIIKELICKSIS